MKEELLASLRNELEECKQRNIEYNNKLKRIRELQTNPKVKEYIRLMNIEACNKLLIRESEEDIINSIYYHYIYKINEKDTNKIFVYMGTYRYTSEIDIIHGANDIRVRYDDETANYRIYQDIEQSNAINVPIKLCSEFEKNNIVINPEGYSKIKEYYKIQKEFFIKAIKTNQENAKKMILRKYPRIKG